MKLGTKLIIYYTSAALISFFIVGISVLKGVERVGLNAIENELVQECQQAQMYINQSIYLYKDYNEVLTPELARSITGYLKGVTQNVKIYDNDFRILSSTLYEENNMKNEKLHTKLLENSLKGDYSYIINQNRVFFVSSISFNDKTIGILEIIYPMDFLQSIIGSIINILVMGALSFILLITVLTVYISWKVVKPVEKLAFFVDRYSKGDFKPVTIKSNDEIGKLCEGFNVMGSKLKEYIDTQKHFVSNVSHELRTPLAAIKGYSEYILEEVNDEELKTPVERLNRETVRLTKLVEQLLLLSRMDSSKETFQLSRINVTELLNEVIVKMGFWEEQYKVKILYTFESDIYVCGDAQKLTQVFINIIDNGIKFSYEGSNIYVKAYKKEDTVSIDVIDEGIGISEEDTQKIFERFYRGNNASGIGGTGLGLSISKEIVDALKGSISIKRNNEKGTKVNILLPLWREGDMI